MQSNFRTTYSDCSSAKDWQMWFNANTCSLLTVTHNTSRFSYYIHGKHLRSVEHHTYLCFELAKEFSWNTHMDNTISSAMRSLNLLTLNVSGCSTNTKDRAYKAIVRPICKYAACAWDLSFDHGLL